MSLQLMPFPWFQRQHALHSSVRFPSIRKDVSTTRTSAGYAKYLQEFLLANIAAERSIFLDLHAVVRSNLGPSSLVLNTDLFSLLE